MHPYNWLDEYLLSKPGVIKDYKLEWGWWRYQIGGKMFAAAMHPSEKYAPEYADKDHWNSVRLDGELSEALMREMCDNSYHLIFDKLTKKAQREILGE